MRCHEAASKGLHVKTEKLCRRTLFKVVVPSGGNRSHLRVTLSICWVGLEWIVLDCMCLLADCDSVFDRQMES